MEPTLEPQTEVTAKPNAFTTVTPLSKYLALVLFVALPFIGGYIGYVSAPEKLVEVVKIVKVNDSPIAAPHILGVEPGFLLEDAPEVDLFTRYTSSGMTTKIYWEQADAQKDLLGITYEGCHIMSSEDARNLIQHRMDVPYLARYIPSPDNVMEGVSCWFAGGGTEMYAFHDIADATDVHVLSFRIGECGLVENCFPYSEAIILR